MAQLIEGDRGIPLGVASRTPSVADALPRRERALAIAALLGLLAVAIGLRLYPVLVVPSINRWDEVFQVTEPAHRLVYGYGLVPWEFQLGMRSWLLPGAVAAIMQFSRLIGEGPD